ncbi:metal-sensitive transcriptional regulator [Kocuria gwangalliensis]|uniref:Metal-sensitive transcriptional regulator n=1 Tax=Kocuria gwangalliensis TaxID=501592 RepID=A0ABP8XDC8_9MICC
MTTDAAADASTDSTVTETGTHAEAHQHGYISDKDRYLARMRRIGGQARGIAKMIDDEKYCIDILTQVSALTRALQGVATGLLDGHLKHCVLDAAKQGDDDAAIAKIQEASDAITRLIKS